MSMTADAWFWMAVGAALPTAITLLLHAPGWEQRWRARQDERLELPWGAPGPELVEEPPDCECPWKRNDAPMHLYWCPRAGTWPAEMPR